MSTGVPSLDRRLNGGLHAGSVLAVIAPPASQSEALLGALMSERPSLYVSTVRRPAAVRADLPTDHDTEFAVEYAGRERAMENEFLQELTDERSFSLTTPGDASPLDDVYDAVARVDGRANVIVDSTNPLEATDDAAAYRSVLNALKTRVLDTDGLGVLHCIDHGTPPALRATTLTVADVVWRLEFVSLSNSVEYKLTMPKNRGGDVVTEELSVVLGRDVHVDDTRNI
jgi:KaiC/GvpD/RAD55 family RecA-like ATPase